MDLITPDEISQSARRWFSLQTIASWRDGSILPPPFVYFCALSNTNIDRAALKGHAESMCGVAHEDAGLKIFKKHTWICGALNQIVLDRCGVSARSDPEHRDRLLSHLVDISVSTASDFPAVWSKILSFTRMIALTDTKSLSGVPFASTSFWDFPLTTFITLAASYYIPPAISFVERSDYAILENLYHEALHQELTEYLRFALLSGGNAIEQTLCWISWRSSNWTMEHCLQALYVYRNLLRMRSEACHARQIDISIETAERAKGDARAACEELEKAIIGRIRPSSFSASVFERIIQTTR